MLSNRILYLKAAALRGELLEVINKWHDDVETGPYGVEEQDRLRLVDALVNYLSGKHARS